MYLYFYFNDLDWYYTISNILFDFSSLDFLNTTFFFNRQLGQQEQQQLEYWSDHRQSIRPVQQQQPKSQASKQTN